MTGFFSLERRNSKDVLDKLKQERKKSQPTVKSNAFLKALDELRSKDSILEEKGYDYGLITDVEELHNWHVEVIKQNPCFRRMSEEEIKDDEFIKDMKNTDEARKVMKKRGNMYIAVYERVDEEIKSLHELYDKIDYSADE